LYVFIALSGSAPFQAYPLVSLPLSPGLFGIAALTIVLALAPFFDRRGIEP
jgi:hypothetical protein